MAKSVAKKTKQQKGGAATTRGQASKAQAGKAGQRRKSMRTRRESVRIGAPKSAAPKAPKPARKSKAATGTAKKTEGTAKKRRYRPGTVALREIRRYQNSTDIVFQKRPMLRVIRQLMQDADKTITKPRITGAAFEMLLEAIQSYFVNGDGSSGLIQQANLAAIHANRVTVQPKDLQLALSVSKGNSDGCSDSEAARYQSDKRPKKIKAEGN